MTSTAVLIQAEPDEHELAPGERDDMISDLIDAMDGWGYTRRHLHAIATEHLDAWLSGDHESLSFHQLCDKADQDLGEAAQEYARYGDSL
jgi:hypothetical protein